MERMIYLAMSGAKQVTLNLASNNNNLANASTTGFRADLDAFRALPVNGPGLPSRVYSSDVRTGVDLQAGKIVATGRDLDVAINGPGYLAIQAPDGSEAYTRAGDLKITAQGQILNGAGHPLLGNDGPVAVPPFERIQIGADGTITVERLLDDGKETVTASLPVVINTVKEINEPRYPSLMGIRKANRANIPVWSAADLGLPDGAGSSNVE